MECPKCQGKKFIEYEHGLIQVECKECDGTGEVEESFIDVMAEANMVANTLMPKLEGEINDDISGDRRDNQSAGSTDTGKPKQLRQSKARKKSAKRPR